MQRQVMGKKLTEAGLMLSFSDVLVRVDQAHAPDLSAQPLAPAAPSPELEAHSEGSDQVGFWQSQTYLEESTRAESSKGALVLSIKLH